MTHLSRGDHDLHHEDGSHRWTPPTANGSVLERHERRLRRHLEAHEAAEPEVTAPYVIVTSPGTGDGVATARSACCHATVETRRTPVAPYEPITDWEARPLAEDRRCSACYQQLVGAVWDPPPPWDPVYVLVATASSGVEGRHTSRATVVYPEFFRAGDYLWQIALTQDMVAEDIGVPLSEITWRCFPAGDPS